jgi:hypothetical protein
VPFFALNFEMAKPYRNHLLKRPKGIPTNEEAKEKLEEINISLREKNTKYHYLNNWVINAPTKEVVVQAQAAKKAVDDTLV